MELSRKGAAAAVTGVTGLTASLKWTTAADFDLAVLYENLSGKYGLIYFGELGDCDDYPYMELSEDQGAGNEQGDCQETVQIRRLDHMAAVWFLCWEFIKVKDGFWYDYTDCDIRLEVIFGDSPERFEIIPEPDASGNVLVLASLLSDPAGNWRLCNQSAVGTLNGLTRIDDVLAIVNRQASKPVDGHL